MPLQPDNNMNLNINNTITLEIPQYKVRVTIKRLGKKWIRETRDLDANYHLHTHTMGKTEVIKYLSNKL